MNSLTLEMLHLHPDDTVLEVGFGGGYLIEKMSHLVTRGRITGIDFSNDSVEFCRKRFGTLIQTGRIDLHCASVESLPFTAETFSKICTVNTIYFWPDPPAALRELYRVLKRHGTLSIGFSPRSVLQKMKVTRHGFSMFEPEDVRAMMAAVGFKNIRLVMGRHREGEFVVAIGTT
jgi:ubiquinone/menaquinone biosynthesis C-methylase UbiE